MQPARHLLLAVALSSSMQASLSTRCHGLLVTPKPSMLCQKSALPRLASSGCSTSCSLNSSVACRPKAVERRTVVVEARGGGNVARGGSGSNISLFDRAIGSVVYLLPFFNSFVYGRFLLYMYPAVRSAISPLLPVVALYNSVPFASLFAFFGIYLGETGRIQPVMCQVTGCHCQTRTNSHSMQSIKVSLLIF
jgi:hypothetical protein